MNGVTIAEADRLVRELGWEIVSFSGYWNGHSELYADVRSPDKSETRALRLSKEVLGPKDFIGRLMDRTLDDYRRTGAESEKWAATQILLVYGAL